jgi:long-chain acyl-CoA synthetase
VTDVAVIGVSDPIRGQAPKAYVVLAKGEQLSEGEIQAFLADKLSPIETPRLFEFPTDLPKSAAGKILKRSV